MSKSPGRKTADLQIAIAVAARVSGVDGSAIPKSNAQSGRIMYIECKAGGLTGTARIGRVMTSKTGRTLTARASNGRNALRFTLFSVCRDPAC